MTMDLKLGRRTPKGAPAIRFSSILAVPAHPPTVDYLAPLPGWQMLGNDTYGDCVAVTWANARRLVTATLATQVYPGLSQVEAIYETQNPGFPADDAGMDIQTLLEYLTKNPGPDGAKAVAFAKVNPGNLDEVRAAIAIFGGIWTGCQVRTANMDDFRAGRPWDYHPDSPLEGGHCVLSGGYRGLVADDARSITWAREISFTDNFWYHAVDEAWVVIWPEHLGTKEFQQGIDLATLAADYKSLTGRDLPVPPPPAPAGCLDLADKVLWAAIAGWAFAGHSGTNRLAAKAAQTWAKAKGLL